MNAPGFPVARALRRFGPLCITAILLTATTCERGRGPLAEAAVFAPLELVFEGPVQTPSDAPARDVAFWVRVRHESGEPAYRIHGFWDGDGAGGREGGVFKIRFTPTEAGRWTLEEVYSSAPELHGQREGAVVQAFASDHPGFWIVDEASPDRRWYRRSGGSHPYIFGNTHYSFLSGYEVGGTPSGNDIASDVSGNARFFKKLRFSMQGDRYPHPDIKPYLDDGGTPTDNGDFSFRPNPEWFHQRVDLAVRTAFDEDLIADFILAGPDTEDARATLRAARNNGDPTPYLRYVVARYGSCPNVWIALSNEYDIRTPRYTEAEIARFGQIMADYLPYPTPLSVHPDSPTLWDAAFDSLPGFADHLIIQRKLRRLGPAADVMQRARTRPDGADRAMPVINDELSYQGEGDGHNEGDTIESHLGAFLGGGYATTGEKPGGRLGQYFRGRFDPSEHSAADNLAFLRGVIDEHVTFWEMAPSLEPISNLAEGFRGMVRPGREFVLGTNQERGDVVATLPEGAWRVTRYDVVAMEDTVIADTAEGSFTFDTPDSRAVLFHFVRQ